jgi:hypothetical protein
MKTTIATVFALAGAAFVAAVEYPPNFPECGKVCSKNMLAKATEFGCEAEDVACICRDNRFSWGVHDCSVESCGDVGMANAVISFGNELCSGAGEAVNIPSATAVGSGAATGSPVTTSEVVSTITSGDSTIVTTLVTTISDDENAGGDATAITTSTWTSVVTSDGATNTVTGETTISGTDGEASGTPTPETTITTPVVSTVTDGSSTFETTISTATITSSDSNDGVEESTSSALGAQMTAAPALGFLAAAGIAAALL